MTTNKINCPKVPKKYKGAFNTLMNKTIIRKRMINSMTLPPVIYFDFVLYRVCTEVSI